MSIASEQANIEPDIYIIDSGVDLSGNDNFFDAWSETNKIQEAWALELGIEDISAGTGDNIRDNQFRTTNKVSADEFEKRFRNLYFCGDENSFELIVVEGVEYKKETAKNYISVYSEREYYKDLIKHNYDAELGCIDGKCHSEQCETCNP